MIHRKNNKKKIFPNQNSLHEINISLDSISGLLWGFYRVGTLGKIQTYFRVTLNSYDCVVAKRHPHMVDTDNATVYSSLQLDELKNKNRNP